MLPLAGPACDGTEIDAIWGEPVDCGWGGRFDAPDMLWSGKKMFWSGLRSYEVIDQFVIQQMSLQVHRARIVITAQKPNTAAQPLYEDDEKGERERESRPRAGAGTTLLCATVKS
jgi:hypothetical protein